ncbi:barstar family protein [Aestuariibacter sp. AA17]|uniref:Barstar family protein n=1 Tax=Fluctibacter corallii TaxID=2984329 RepID=A0ABT3A7Q0_9ALTE|nr:barstar family protein [Aestuariibacter sp. AA17]MCV2884718.1 barstar family protein [Aestuariibacter sp. AA17]
MSCKFIFVEEFPKFDKNYVHIGNVELDISNSFRLLECLFHTLEFPDYFGFNWNALDDCLTDFSWLSKKNIILIHDGVPHLPSNELDIYLKILHDAIINWEADSEVSFEVYFYLKHKNKILNFFNSQ